MLDIKKKKITDKIFLLEFENQFEIASTLLRFQEYYESPKFKGKVFALEEFKEWYSSVKGEEFSYYTDWNAFNFPSFILKPFYEGKFDPLTEGEKQILESFKDEKEEFYVIAIYKEYRMALKHEISHALMYANENYKKGVMEILSKYDTQEIKAELKSKEGYHEDVLDDEVHAWILESGDKLKSKIPDGIKEELEENYGKFSVKDS